ncbi:MAG: DNA alkylation repair protein [Clostridia bacterium]|nr:DNA alkylation repair protein [Clostridia bacterium]
MENLIRNELFKLKDDKYKEFHSSLCPGVDTIIGVRVPVLRKYAKELAKINWKENFIKIQNDYYEEIMLQGMIIGIAIKDIKELKIYLEDFIPKIDNWAVCDVCCAGLKLTQKNQEEMWDFLQKYLKSNKEFEIRFGIVMLLDYYINENYIDRILKIFDNIKSDFYYVKMAVAWAISICYIKFPKETEEYLKDNNLDEFTYKKSIQKIKESYRVSKEQKQKLEEQGKNYKI